MDKEAGQPPPVTDSPWFWLLLFSLMGLGAIGAIHGKYGRRQAGIERQYQARDRVARGVAVQDVTPPAMDQGNERTGPRPYSMPGENLIPLWPLVAAIGSVAVFSAVMLLRETGRRRRSALIDDGSEPK
jgi:hypothetical protein